MCLCSDTPPSIFLDLFPFNKFVERLSLTFFLQPKCALVELISSNLS